MKIIKWLLIIVGGFFAVALTIGSLVGNDREYRLAIVNGGETPATVSVSLNDGSWTVPPDESLNVTIGGQGDDDVKTERIFTIKSGGRTTEVQGKVGYSGTMLLDVTGASCVAAADYGRQYRPKDKVLPEGERDIVVTTIYRGRQLYKVEEYIGTPLGEALPDTVKASHGSIPTHHRLIRMPCGLANDAEGLYQFLNAN